MSIEKILVILYNMEDVTLIYLFSIFLLFDGGFDIVIYWGRKAPQRAQILFCHSSG